MSFVVSTPVHSASAGRLWCKSDPIVSLNGRLVDLTVSIPLDMLLAVNGPIQITIWTPATVDRHVILSDVGFFGHGSVVTFRNSGQIQGDSIPTVIRISVPIDAGALAPGETVPTELTVTPDNQLPTTVAGTHERTTMKMTINGH